MKNIINQLSKISETSSDREQKTIKNLISRIESFEKIGNREKLSECLGEANLWGAK